LSSCGVGWHYKRFLNMDRPGCLSENEAFALTPLDIAADIVIDWMSAAGFRGGDIARVVRSLDDTSSPSVRVTLPDGDFFDVAVERVLESPAQAVDLYGATVEWMNDVRKVYETSPVAASEMVLTIVALKMRSRDPEITAELVGLDNMLCDDLEVFESDCTEEFTAGEVADTQLLMASAIRNVSTIAVHTPDAIMRPSTMEGMCVAPLDDGLYAVSKSIGVANVAAQMCCAFGRHHPIARRFIGYIDRGGTNYPPGEIPDRVPDGVHRVPRHPRRYMSKDEGVGGNTGARLRLMETRHTIAGMRRLRTPDG